MEISLAGFLNNFGNMQDYRSYEWGSFGVQIFL